MSETDSYAHMDPAAIIVRRNTRQRQENIEQIDDLKASIAKVGLINPIVVRRTDEGIVLVAGERRLKASLALELTSVPIRFLDELSEHEAEVVELEENIKRAELTWRDQVKAIGRLHDLYRAEDSSWTIQQTADAVSLHRTYMGKILHVYAALPTGRIDKAESIEQAYNTIQRFVERKAESIVSDLIVQGAAIFGTMSPPTPTPSIPTTTSPQPSVTPTITTWAEGPIAPEVAKVASQPQVEIPPPPPPSNPIVCASFLDWIKTYNGPKFTLIHCDFPYGNYKGNDSKGAMSALETEDFYDNTESVYWTLLDALTENLDKVMSYSAYMVFWFNMNFYTETVRRLRKVGLNVHDHPLIWHKTGGPGGLGVAPGTEATHPRRTYDTALLAVRGNRPLVRTMCNSYAAPTAGNKIHPSQKPEPMLRYFLQMFVDETASVFDPTCGSAAALRAAEDLGAKSILGLEMDPNYAQSANTKTLQARILRQAGSKIRED